MAANFRRELLSHDALTQVLKQWAHDHPDFVRLESAGVTPEGRDIWVLVVGREPDRLRPAAWIDGNMHASEVAGSSVCLAIAEDLIQMHIGRPGPLPTPGPRPSAGETVNIPDLPGPVRQQLEDSLVYIMPRMSPDGAEAVVTSARYVRSVPRDDRAAQLHPRWRAEDIDGDGQCLLMRIEDPTGEYVDSDEAPGLMLVRQIADEGPFYRLYPEGVIDHWDGISIPTPSYLGDNDPDLNRNFPYHWAPDPKQQGAGRFPLSEPETRAVVTYTTARPHLFVWLNLHTFGGVHIRPLGGAVDSKMLPDDLALYKQLEAWADSCTGYPMVSGFEEFTYDPGTPLHGDLVDYAYHQRGCLTWVTELWDIFAQLGLKKPKRFVDFYSQLEREDFVALARWDKTHNEGRLFPPWTKTEHPQLGKVEVGGLDPRFGIWNPPPAELEKICRGMSAMFLRTVSIVPRIALTPVSVAAIGEDHYRVEVQISNTGYMATGGVEAAAECLFNEPLHVMAGGNGINVQPHEQKRSIGHLGGWGHGRHGGFGSLFFQRSRGSTNRQNVVFNVRGAGVLVVRAGSARVGYVDLAVDLADLA